MTSICFGLFGSYQTSARCRCNINSSNQDSNSNNNNKIATLTITITIITITITLNNANTNTNTTANTNTNTNTNANAHANTNDNNTNTNANINTNSNKNKDHSSSNSELLSELVNVYMYRERYRFDSYINTCICRHVCYIPALPRRLVYRVMQELRHQQKGLAISSTVTVRELTTVIRNALKFDNALCRRSQSLAVHELKMRAEMRFKDS